MASTLIDGEGPGRRKPRCQVCWNVPPYCTCARIPSGEAETVIDHTAHPDTDPSAPSVEELEAMMMADDVAELDVAEDLIVRSDGASFQLPWRFEAEEARAVLDEWASIRLARDGNRLMEFTLAITGQVIAALMRGLVLLDGDLADADDEDDDDDDA